MWAELWKLMLSRYYIWFISILTYKMTEENVDSLLFRISKLEDCEFQHNVMY
jgi:hypothetical protein